MFFFPFFSRPIFELFNLLFILCFDENALSTLYRLMCGLEMQHVLLLNKER
jgi:hypothetical protein